MGSGFSRYVRTKAVPETTRCAAPSHTSTGVTARMHTAIFVFDTPERTSRRRIQVSRYAITPPILARVPEMTKPYTVR